MTRRGDNQAIERLRAAAAVGLQAVSEDVSVGTADLAALLNQIASAPDLAREVERLNAVYAEQLDVAARFNSRVVSAEKEAERFARRVEELEEALEDQIKRWEALPSGVDYEADENNPSPEDAFQHVAGLAIREARRVLAKGSGK